MTFRAVSAALAATALVAPTLPGFAQDKSGINAGPAPEAAAPGGAASMALAHELYALGLARGDAVTVLAAAKLAASVDVGRAEPAALDPGRIALADAGQGPFRKKAVPSAPAPMMREGKPRPVAKASFFSASSADEGAADGPVSSDAMFAKAAKLAADDAALLGVIEDTMAEGARGRIGGAVQWPSRLPAGQTDVWEVPFHGNSHAELAVVGDGDANLDIAVTDENGNVLCYDVSGSDSLYCDFSPAWDGYFYVTVQNTGRVRNSYHLLTN